MVGAALELSLWSQVDFTYPFSFIHQLLSPSNQSLTQNFNLFGPFLRVRGD